MRIPLLLCCLSLTAVVVAGCAVGPSEADKQYARIQQAEKMWGPASQWTPRQMQVFQGMEAVAQVQEAQQAAQRAAVAAAIGNGLKSAGDQIAGAQTDPFILYRLNNRQSSTQYRSWHNSDGTSGRTSPIRVAKAARSTIVTGQRANTSPTPAATAARFVTATELLRTSILQSVTKSGNRSPPILPRDRKCNEGLQACPQTGGRGWPPEIRRIIMTCNRARNFLANKESYTATL